MKKVSVFLAMGILLSSSSCKKNDALNIQINYKKGEPLATVGGYTLSLEALNEDFMQRQGQFKGAIQLNSEQKKQEYIESQTTQEALFLEAVKNDYFNNPEILRDIKKIVVQKLMRDKLSSEENTTPPTEEAMKEYYEKNQNLYNRAEAQKVSFLEIAKSTDKKSKFLAESIHKEAKKSVTNNNPNILSQIAMKHMQKAEGTSQVTVQMTGFLEKEPFDAKFAQGSFETIKQIENIGEVAPLVQNDKSFFIIMKTGSRKELKESFEEAKAKIEKRLGFEMRNQNYEQYVKSLNEKYKIFIDKEKVAKLGNPATNQVADAQANQ